MTISSVGVVGLGNMGLPMAVTLVRAGFNVIGFDLSAERRALAAAQGIRAVAEVALLLRAVDAVVSSLPHGCDVEALVRTPGGLLERRDRRVMLVDTSTSMRRSAAGRRGRRRGSSR
jgi:3-hydroxyisobutyrate dehydrogenase